MYFSLVQNLKSNQDAISVKNRDSYFSEFKCAQSSNSSACKLSVLSS